MSRARPAREKGIAPDEKEEGGPLPFNPAPPSQGPVDSSDLLGYSPLSGDSPLETIRGQAGQMLAELDKLVGFGAVRGWLNRNPVEALFADVIFGTIRWPKGIGRPSTPSLHEGFQAEHQWTRPEIRTGPEGPVTVYEVEQDAAPILVDGPVDASEYRVSFVDRFIGQPNEAIVVTLKDVDWDAAAPFEGVRQIECIGSPALPDRHATAVLPNMKTGRPIFVAFEVVIKTIVVRT